MHKCSYMLAINIFLNTHNKRYECVWAWIYVNATLLCRRVYTVFLTAYNWQTIIKLN